MRGMIFENTSDTLQICGVLCDPCRIEDMKISMNAGCDPDMMASLGNAPAGVGKRPLEPVVLTHSDSKHDALLRR